MSLGDKWSSQVQLSSWLHYHLGRFFPCLARPDWMPSLKSVTGIGNKIGFFFFFYLPDWSRFAYVQPKIVTSSSNNGFPSRRRGDLAGFGSSACDLSGIHLFFPSRWSRWLVHEQCAVLCVLPLAEFRLREKYALQYHVSPGNQAQSEVFCSVPANFRFSTPKIETVSEHRPFLRPVQDVVRTR